MNELFDNISEWSYQRYSRFYGRLKPSDKQFNDKMSKIYSLIIEKEYDDLELIAKESNCSYEECIMKIRYLKNKRKIGNYYIDTINKKIKKCSEEDENLLIKYSPFIYNKHYQIDEIASRLPNANLNNLDELQEEVYNDIKYLDSKNLINGIILNDVDKKIIYYTIEKHKNEKDYITINCRNCGAINDVNRGGKTRCAYCKTIVEDTSKKD